MTDIDDILKQFKKATLDEINSFDCATQWGDWDFDMLAGCIADRLRPIIEKAKVGWQDEVNDE